MYANQCIRFERRGEFVQPVRVRREWVSDRNGRRRFITTRLTEVSFGPVEYPEEYLGAPRADVTRESLIAGGLLRPIGHGEPCLPLGNQAEWFASTVDSVPPWSDEEY